MPTFLVTAIPIEPVQFTIQVDNSNCIASVIGKDYEIKTIEEIQVDYSTHAPHIEIEYDKSYWGGDYTQVGDYAYIPFELVDAIGAEEAFQIATGCDRANIVNVNHSEDEQIYRKDGTNWFEAAEDWAVEQSKQLKQEGRSFVQLIITNPERIELQRDPGEKPFATYETGTRNLELVKALCETVKREFLYENIEVAH